MKLRQIQIRSTVDDNFLKSYSLTPVKCKTGCSNLIKFRLTYKCSVIPLKFFSQEQEKSNEAI